MINGAPTVAEKLRLTVHAAMRELDYKPDRAARLLRGGTAHALGLIIGSPVSALNRPDSDRRLSSCAEDIMQRRLQACRTAEYHLVIESVSPMDDRAQLPHGQHARCAGRRGAPSLRETDASLGVTNPFGIRKGDSATGRFRQGWRSARPSTRN